ncbi:MAG TPA: hypothetical protein VNQ90_15440 [Chthoniobacteraceae bacterium]|nr:hypothetical protein [Chthoniobacteraceae bacterium]
MKTPPLLACTALLLLQSALFAQDLYWNPQGGSTDWNTTAQNWSETEVPSAWQGWPAISGYTGIARFTANGGEVNVGDGLFTGGLAFETPGVALSSAAESTLTLAGSAPEIEVATGLTATLGANLRLMSQSKTFTKTGAGTLEITYSHGTDKYLGPVSSTTQGAKITIAEGTLRVTGNGLNNTWVDLSVASGATLAVNSTLNVGTLTGSGAVSNSTGTAYTLQIRGLDQSFSGVVSGNLNFSKINSPDTFTFSGSQSNTYSGNTTVNVGELILAKTGGAVAVAGTQIILGANNNTGLAQLTLAGEGQIASTVDLSFVEGNRRTARFALEGHSATLGTLILGNLGANGSFTIDFGMNETAQLLSFAALSTAGTGDLNLLNFGDNDELRFLADPTAGLGQLFINGLDVTAVDRGEYWTVAPIPEPRALLGVGALLLVLALRNRRLHA